MLRLYPSIMASTVRHFLQLPTRGVVLQCYGSGNVPSNRQDILEAIRDGSRSGVLILVVTQCHHGAVSGHYETGQAVLDMGAISGSDITPDAALAKLAHVLSLNIRSAIIGVSILPSIILSVMMRSETCCGDHCVVR